jgi:ubiquinol-cytochrome c reductase cytochrome c subunit
MRGRGEVVRAHPSGAGAEALVRPALWLAAPLVIVAALTPLLLRAGPAAGQAPGPEPEPPAVRDLYLRDCATCHGADGRGTTRGPTLVGVGRAWTDYMLTTGRMPISDPDIKTRRRAPAYSPETIQGLVDYVEGFGGGGTDIPEVRVEEADLALGGEIFGLQCAACHAWAGDGGALAKRYAPALHSSTPVQIAEAVRVGPGTMPAFGTAAVPDDQLDALVAYVRYLDHPEDRGGQPLWHLGPLVEGAVAWVVGMSVLYLAVRWLAGHR